LAQKNPERALRPESRFGGKGGGENWGGGLRCPRVKGVDPNRIRRREEKTRKKGNFVRVKTGGKTSGVFHGGKKKKEEAEKSKDNCANRVRKRKGLVGQP